ncbi:MAG: hypothetical protein ABW022_15065, partial [Actinoplanes sp.]
MKFFSNEAKENTDDPDRTDDDVAAVPQQRAGSPWNDTPRDADDESADRDAADRAPDDRDRPEDADRPWSQAGDGSSETVSSTTTYGPDGSVVTRPDDSSSIASDSSASSPAPDSSSVATDSSASSPGYDSDRDDDSDRDGSDRDGSDRDRVDGSDAVKDDGTFDSPTAVEPTTGKPLDGGVDADSKDSDVAAVPVAADEPVTTPDEDTAHAGDATPVVATAAVPAAGAAQTTGSSGDRLF